MSQTKQDKRALLVEGLILLTARTNSVFLDRTNARGQQRAAGAGPSLLR
ncbi:MAG: hypothetical protein JWM08_1700 [Candidatus Angelobacter sp.]|nr:hypothetical protein [Candidatus Angelobacter sp.]MCU1332708.1 hypothetical protein [Candidatus Angelobacter sp.]